MLVLQMRTPRHREVRPPAPGTQVSNRQDLHSQKLSLPWFTFRAPPSPHHPSQTLLGGTSSISHLVLRPAL